MSTPRRAWISLTVIIAIVEYTLGKAEGFPVLVSSTDFIRARHLESNFRMPPSSRACTPSKAYTLFPAILRRSVAAVLSAVLSLLLTKQSSRPGP